VAEKGAIPTSRLSRSTKVGRLAASTAAKQMGTRATNVARSDEGKQRALAKRQPVDCGAVGRDHDLIGHVPGEKAEAFIPLHHDGLRPINSATGREPA